MDAFDADVLIYAAVPGHPLGRRVRALFPTAPPGKSPGSLGRAGVGSVLLLPELLAKPLRDGQADAVTALSALLARLDLRPVDRATAELATVLAARYRLRAADAVHLATAITMGAKRFITNNGRDFGPGITEVDVTYPGDLPDGALRGAFGAGPIRHPLRGNGDVRHTDRKIHVSQRGSWSSCWQERSESVASRLRRAGDGSAPTDSRTVGGDRHARPCAASR